MDNLNLTLFDILWDCDETDKDFLPKEVVIPREVWAESDCTEEEMIDNAVEYLSDYYGYCVISFTYGFENNKMLEKARRIAYNIYIEKWKLDHLSPESEFNQMISYAKDFCDYASDADDCDYIDYQDYLFENGYNGSLYVSYNEFLQAEYQNDSFMKELLPEKLYNLIKTYEKTVD